MTVDIPTPIPECMLFWLIFNERLFAFSDRPRLNLKLNSIISIPAIRHVTNLVKLTSDTTEIYCDVLGYLITSEHQNVTCSVLETPFGLLLCFIYDFTSRHYNYFLQCALFTSVLLPYLGWSSDCWLLGCCSNLTPLICSDVTSLIGSFDLLWRWVSDQLLRSALTLRLWSAPLISSDVAFLIGSVDLSKSTLLSRSSRAGARTPCPRVVLCLQLGVG
jgi:hypothetical protein